MSLEHVAAFTRPATLAEAFQLVADGAIPVSGGTDVILRRRLGEAVLADLTGLPLAGIVVGYDAVVIGGTTTLTEMLEHEALEALAGGVLVTMLRRVGSPLLRNVATIGGHLARGRLSDIVPVLLALDASIQYHDGEDRTDTLESFYADGKNVHPFIVTGLTIPVPRDSSASAFRKFSRTGFDLAILNAACHIDLEGNRVSTARVVVGETPALGARVPAAEEELLGEPLDARTIDRAAATAASAIPAGDDDRGSAGYRRALAEVLVRRCLLEIQERLP
ncbi:MAG TPA: FAD binding domain-containing protein [Acidimicrobiia bacterium]|nr:FAD binding domain-containing protein [Acidimicrobiia bacterium]